MIENEIKKPRMPLYTVPNEIVKEIIEDYKSGMMKKDIASKYKLSTYYITHCLETNNIPLNDRSRANKEPKWKKVATEMYYNGKTLDSISEKVGMHSRTLSIYFKQSGATDEKKRRMMESYQPVIDSWIGGMTEPQLLEKFPQFSKNNIHHIVNKFCPKRNEKIEEEEIIESLPRVEPKEKIRFVRVERKVYADITDLIAGV